MALVLPSVAGRPRLRRGTVAARDRASAAAMVGFAVQAVLVTGLVTAYHFARALADDRVATAFGHSTRLWRLERSVGLPSELTAQQWLLAHPSVARAADAYYAGVHFPFTGAVLVWLYIRRREIYRRTRDVLVLLTAAGLVLAFVFPLAPPRMRADLGFTDVAAHFGQSVYGPPGTGTANQFGAMPSLHVGWALLVALALVAAGRTWRRWLWLAHPLLTTAIVVGTGNHYWADGLVATVLLLVATVPVLLLDRRSRTPGHRSASGPATAPPAGHHPFGTRRSPSGAAHPTR